MTTVGIRELKAHTSEIMRRVESGEAVSITNHGRIVARIVPATVTEDEIARSLALLDGLDQEAQAIEWPEGSIVVSVMRDVRRNI